MNRRQLLSRSASFGLLSAAKKLPALGLTEKERTPPGRMIKGRAVAHPTPDQERWEDLEMGVFVHFGNETYLHGRSHDFSVPPSEVNPVDLDTDQWVRTAADAGAHYVVFTAKHGYGFCSWQTATTDFSLKSSPWRNGKGDIMRDLSESCRKFGLGLGVYLAPADLHFGAATGGICKTPAEQDRYNRVYRAQLTELLANYGPITEVWFDGATVTPVSDILLKYQPHAAVFQGPTATIRWVGNEDGIAPYPCWNGIDRGPVASHGTATALDSDPNGSIWLPSEADVSIRRPEWFWTETNEKDLLTDEQLMTIYYCSVGRGTQLLLNMPPNPKGLFDEKDVAVATRFGAEVKRRFSKPLAHTSGRGMQVELMLEKPTRVDTVILQEEISLGERVRAYIVEGRTNGEWKAVGDGIAIGHKRIQPITPTMVDALRLAVTEAVALPAIRTLAAFDTGVAPPPGWNRQSYLWAPDLAGEWSGMQFHLDLGKHVHEARQYKVRFVPDSGKVTALTNLVLILGGADQPKLLKRVPGRPDELILDVTGMGDTGTLSGEIEGATAGHILLGRM